VHFGDTSAVAFSGDELAGWVSAFLLPSDRTTLFVWQIAVRETVRGRGIGRRLIADVLGRPASRHVRWVAATITADNIASWGLFEGLARSLGAELERTEGFDKDRHFAGRHASELAVRIGPIGAAI
jgi:L-2,4-diaminobutyric acid acetyltransferase